jgi:uncharacterized tellurite resistance protein B-like protein
MRLLDELKDHLKRRPPLVHDQTGAVADLEVQASTALLLIEAAWGDEEYVWREHRAIVRGLKRAFGLTRPDVLSLLKRSEQIRPPVVRLADVTDVIRERYDGQQRREVVRLLWQVVDADGIETGWERIFATHVARTVGISDEETLALRQAQ